MKLKRILLSGCSLALSLGALAVDFRSGDLYYTILDESAKTVEVGSLEAWQNDTFGDQFVNLQENVTKAESKYLNNVGDGVNLVGVSFTWGDTKALDNLASGVYAKKGQTVNEVLGTLLTNDRRYYSIYSSKISQMVGFGFDTNGDGKNISVTVGDKTFSDANNTSRYLGAWDIMDVQGLNADINYADAVAESQYDHWAVNNATDQWHILVNGEEADYDTVVEAGNMIRMVYGSAAPAEEFLLRPADRQGIWMAEKVVIDTANGKQAYFPMIANVCGDSAYLYGSGVGAEVYETDDTTTARSYSAYVADGAKGGMSLRLSVSDPKTAHIRPFLNIRKDWGTGSATVKRVYPEYFTEVTTKVANPLTGISLEGVEEGGVIEVDNMGVAILKPVLTPSNADFTTFSVKFDDEKIATYFASVKAVVAHSAGDTKMTLSSPDGSVKSEYTVRVKGVDATDRPEGDFSEGLIWLNEEWFTHTSGSLNFLDDAGNIYYRAYGNQNNNMAFGGTSCYATVWADKLIVMSKLAWDGGDTRPLRSGGRVVVADAKTFKHIGAIEEIGGDGRSCLGVTPSKVYLGTTKGVRVMDLDELTVADSDIEGITMARSGQIGNMAKSGKYAFVANIGTGLEIIDTETDTHVKTIDNTGIQTVVQAADGRIWYATSNTLTPVDPVTLEAGTAYKVPGSITCSSGSWRPGNLMAAHNSNTLIWGSGTFYRWNIDEVADPSALTPVYTHKSTIDGKKVGSAYGAPGYDDLTDTYMFAATSGFGAAALQNWYHFVDATTGAIRKSMRLNDYWWFPSMPVQTDRYDVEINIDDIMMNPGAEARTYDLSKLITDRDNHDCNISYWIGQEGQTRAAGVADVTLEGSTLTVAPVGEGSHYFTLNAESNGRVVSKDINVLVASNVGVDANFVATPVVYTVYTMGGVAVASVESTDMINSLQLSAGVYVVRGSNGKSLKAIVK
ncbi:MAG: DUF5074 domain-containing protein [Muribaculum sp.]|nr:DUF5074 domain-containing protein [Muribaculum sp.]